ncbi:hypothetical protein Syun_024115 [Stephania yunnanensis]|uniref:Pentatricopeptide repeat-containing protein n=1 Tax=Stephania yunnanensis TaxID=152371 RepID=A0AAP0I3Y4_9MAGN
MIIDYSIDPLAEHYACMVDLLGRAGRVEEAYQLISKMPIKANAGTWGALLGACKMHRRLELGKLAAQKLFEFEPHKTSNYVLLSNMHAEAGRWQEVEKLRRLMKERKVDKQPGCSWVEVKNRVHSFISDDSTQPLTVEIFDTLQCITMHIRNTGYIPEISLH